MSPRWSSLLAALSVVACGRSELPAFHCGDGVVEPDRGEQCDLGEDNTDRPAIVLIHQATRRPVMPFETVTSAVSFYDYDSESSHTGLEERDLSVLLLHRDTTTEALSLVVHHGIDEDATGVTLDHGLVDLDLSGLPSETGVLLADEPEDEVFFDGDGEARGRWEFWRNSDGAVFGTIPFPGTWRIVAEIALRDGVDRWTFVAKGGEEHSLSSASVAVLQAYDTPSPCRRDCTIPRCGDGIVDGGEICDDGNTIDGDGCSDACSSLR